MSEIRYGMPYIATINHELCVGNNQPITRDVSDCIEKLTISELIDLLYKGEKSKKNETRIQRQIESDVKKLEDMPADIRENNFLGVKAVRYFDSDEGDYLISRDRLLEPELTMRGRGIHLRLDIKALPLFLEESGSKGRKYMGLELMVDGVLNTGGGTG